jgi:hypothetical protein
MDHVDTTYEGTPQNLIIATSTHFPRSNSEPQRYHYADTQ